MERFGQYRVVTDPMDAAIAAAGEVDGYTSPNPWVGATLVTANGATSAATSPRRGPHAEANVMSGHDTRGATLFVTLEPCTHHGFNPPCVDSIIDSGIETVVYGIEDPDRCNSGSGLDRLRAAGIEVRQTDRARQARIEEQLTAYLKQRRTGRPQVVLKMAMTLDGRVAAPDGSSFWITGPEARSDVHRLRARCDAVIVGAGTVRIDDPRLNVRLDDVPGHRRNPLRVFVGDLPEMPDALVWRSSLAGLLDHLGGLGHLRVLVEGGSGLAGSFHREGLVDRCVIYVAPALLGGGDGIPVLGGRGEQSLADASRGRFVDVTRLGNDIRLTFEPTRDPS